MQNQTGWEFPDFSVAKKTNRLIRIVFGADFRKGHPGLSDQAKKLGLKLNDLEPGEFVLFINNRKNGVKFFAGSGQMLAYFKMPGNRQINTKVLKILPRYFNGTALNYDGALKELIEQEIRGELH